MSNNVDQIKDRLDIVDVVGSYIKLEKAGGNWRARCPFHNERTPSFFVSPMRQTYHCFGCDQGGDMLTFVQEMEGLDFRGALQLLAREAGVELGSFSPSQQSEKDKLYALLEDSCIWHQRNLTKQEDALAYLYKRGLQPETLKAFRLGFAPNAWQELSEFLKTSGYSEADIKKVGLSAQSERGTYDRFRSRIMFPLTDNVGRVVGFSGRIFGKEDENTAKYINSPETDLYNKSRVLYGFDKAKHAIRKNRTAILVEGQMDLLMSHQAGFPYTVATSGTALSDAHATALSRLADTLILAFDADEAGVRAGLRAAGVALARGLDVRAIAIAGGKDPADIILEDPEEWKKQVESAEHIVLARLKQLKNEFSDTREFRKKATQEVMPLVARIESSVDRAHFIQETAKLLLLPEDTVREEVERAQQSIQKEYTPSDDSEGKDAREEKQGRKERTLNHIIGILLWQETLEESAVDVESAWEKLGNVWGGDARKQAETLPEEEKQKRIFEAEVQYTKPDKIQGILDDSFNGLEQLRRKEEATNILERIRAEEAQGKNTEELLRKYQELSRGLHN